MYNTMLIIHKYHTLAKAMVNVPNIFTVRVQTDTAKIMLARIDTQVELDTNSQFNASPAINYFVLRLYWD